MTGGRKLIFGLCLIATSCSIQRVTDLPAESDSGSLGGAAGWIGGGGFGGSFGGSAGTAVGGSGALDSGTDAPADVEPDVAPDVEAGVFVPSDIANLAIWLEPDFADLVLDGTQGVQTWPNHGALGGVLEQSKGGERPIYGNIAGKFGVQFVGSRPSSLESTIPVSQLRFLHDGTGATVVAVVRPEMAAPALGVVWLTGIWFGADAGALLFFDAASSRFQFHIGNGTGPVAKCAFPVGSTPANASHTLTTRLLATAPTPLEFRVNATPGVACPLTGPLANADPKLPFVLGTNGVESTKKATAYTGWIFALLAYNRRLEDFEVTQVEQYLAAKYKP